MDGNKEIPAILSGYVDRRDNAKKRTVFNINGPEGSLSQISKFNDMINDFHLQLFGCLPPLNLAQVEALAELVNSHLSWMRAAGIR